MRRARRLLPSLLPLLVLLACAAPPAARRPADLLNPRLSPGLSQWLVGPVSHLATADEVQRYLALGDDAAAQAFIADFWRRRDPAPPAAGRPFRQPNLRERFEQRAAAADRRFTEAGYLGRRTDRGTILVLYGEPSKIEFDVDPERPEAPVEHWTYDPGAPPGLDGKRPQPAYRFVKQGDLTVLVHPSGPPVPLPPPAAEHP